MTSTSFLRLEDVGFAYEGGTGRALDHLNATLPLGAVVAIIGPQACGKTTLLRAVAGSLGPIFSGALSGRIGFDDAPGEASRPVGPDDVASFFDSYVQVTLSAESVREEIGLPLLAQGVAEVERDRRASLAAHELRIQHLLDRPTTALSGGEEKLVGLAAALCASATVYLFDEPFEQLDVDHLRAIIKAIKDRARRGSLVLVATGSLDIALNIADAALLFEHGVWRVDSAPSYQMLADSAATLGSSQVLSFLGGADVNRPPLERIHSFRDAVMWKASA